MTATAEYPTKAIEQRQERPIAIHLEVTFLVAPECVYELLTDSAKFAAATDRPASIGTAEGEAFTIFGGYIHGRQIELVPGERIVQAWRGAEWAPGVYSVVRFTLTRKHRGTHLAIDHDAYPDEESPMYPSWHEHLATNWPVFYFAPFARYFASEFPWA
jgi:uncharacterized protein YndB with AHSA1/START domain